MSRATDPGVQAHDSRAVGLAGLTLFSLGLLTSLMPLLFLPSLDGELSFSLLGTQFGVPSALALAVWPLGPLSIVGGFLVMLGRDRRLGLLCAGTWMSLGLVAVVSGAIPGLLLVGLALTAVLWRNRSASSR